VSGDYTNEELATAVAHVLRKGDRDLALRILDARPAEARPEPESAIPRGMRLLRGVQRKESYPHA
jgi:hypothetical protein